MIALSAALLFGCDTPHGPAVSETISDARHRGVFVREYTAVANIYSITGTFRVRAKEIWAEQVWYYGRSNDETLLTAGDRYQLCINCSERDLIGCMEDWTIGVATSQYLHPAGAGSLAGNLPHLPGDTITYFIQRGNDFNGDTSGRIIGRISFIGK